ncbi:MAG TPA: hypothetical protein VK461_00905, partial [Acidimicrobiales bacterium]|nr:hypothetical protein [Acidimicrobiales bacterium]
MASLQVPLGENVRILGEEVAVWTFPLVHVQNEGRAQRETIAYLAGSANVRLCVVPGSVLGVEVLAARAR